MQLNEFLTEFDKLRQTASKAITYMREALDELSVARLASRIDELRKAGHPIITEVVTGKNRYGEPTRWARYRMGARG